MGFSLGSLGDGDERRKRTTLLVVALLGVLLVLGIAFLRPNEDAGPPGTVPILEPVVVGERVSRLAEPDAGVDVPKGPARDCTLAALDRNTELVEALGDSPQSSPRFGELQAIAEKCRFQTDGNDALTASLKGKAPGTLTDAQLACLRGGVAAYSDDERRQVVDTKLVDLAPGPLRDKARELVTICGIDPGTIGFA